MAIEKMMKMKKGMKSQGLNFSFGVVEIKGRIGVKRAVEKADERMYKMKKKN